MCEAEDMERIFTWEGWAAPENRLKSYGWRIQYKPPYNNWRDPSNSRMSSHKLYLRHEETRMIGRFSNRFSLDYNQCPLDFMTLEYNRRTKPPRVLDERELSAEDIPMLLDVILLLQEQLKQSHRKQYQPLLLQAAS